MAGATNVGGQGTRAAAKKPLWKSLYFQVICAIILGIVLMLAAMLPLFTTRWASSYGRARRRYYTR